MNSQNGDDHNINDCDSDFLEENEPRPHKMIKSNQLSSMLSRENILKFYEFVNDNVDLDKYRLLQEKFGSNDQLKLKYLTDDKFFQQHFTQSHGFFFENNRVTMNENEEYGFDFQDDDCFEDFNCFKEQESLIEQIQPKIKQSFDRLLAQLLSRFKQINDDLNLHKSICFEVTKLTDKMKHQALGEDEVRQIYINIKEAKKIELREIQSTNSFLAQMKVQLDLMNSDGYLLKFVLESFDSNKLLTTQCLKRQATKLLELKDQVNRVFNFIDIHLSHLSHFEKYKYPFVNRSFFTDKIEFSQHHGLATQLKHGLGESILDSDFLTFNQMKCVYQIIFTQDEQLLYKLHPQLENYKTQRCSKCRDFLALAQNLMFSCGHFIHSSCNQNLNQCPFCKQGNLKIILYPNAQYQIFSNELICSLLKKAQPKSFDENKHTHTHMYTTHQKKLQFDQFFCKCEFEIVFD